MDIGSQIGFILMCLIVQITKSHDRPRIHWVFTSTMTIQQAENHVSE